MKDYKIRVSGFSSQVDEEILQKTFVKGVQGAEVILKGRKAVIVSVVLGQT